MTAINARMPPGFLLDTVKPQQTKAVVSPAPVLTEPRKRKATNTEHIPGLVALVKEMKAHPKAHFASLLGLNWTLVEQKLEDREYHSVYEFALDVRKMLTSTFKKFPAGSAEYIAAVEMSDSFEQALVRKDTDSPRKPAVHDQVEVPAAPLTLHEKQLLAASIRRLDKSYLRRIVDIVSGAKQSTYTEEFEFDIDKLSPKIGRELETYVRQCLRKQTQSVSPSLPPPPQVVTKSVSSSSSSSSSSDSEEDNGNPSGLVPI